MIKVILSITAIILIIFGFRMEGINPKKQVKPVRMTQEYMKQQGYEIYENDFFYVSGDNREAPIHIICYSIPGDKKITNETQYEYYKGEIRQLTD